MTARLASDALYPTTYPTPAPIESADGIEHANDSPSATGINRPGNVAHLMSLGHSEVGSIQEATIQFATVNFASSAIGIVRSRWVLRSTNGRSGRAERNRGIPIVAADEAAADLRQRSMWPRLRPISASVAVPRRSISGSYDFTKSRICASN